MTKTLINPVNLQVQAITANSFAPFGTLIEPAEDGKPFGLDEAQLDLARGTPRFYVMRLHFKEKTFTHITRHLAVTQCLASVGGKDWMIAVAPPNDPDNPHAKPEPKSIQAFKVPGNCAISLHRATWHAGPFFDEPSVDFFNLELADTNIVDHHNCRLDVDYGMRFHFVDQVV